MNYTVDHKGKSYEFTWDQYGVAGCCGMCSISCMTVPDAVKELPPADRREVAYLLGQYIVRRAYRSDYGIALFTTLVQGVPMADPFSAYYGSHSDGHKESFNLGTVARALGGRKGVSATNPNTGNEITSYTVNTGDHA